VYFEIAHLIFWIFPEIGHQFFPFFCNFIRIRTSFPAPLERREPLFPGFQPAFLSNLKSDIEARFQNEEMSDFKNGEKEGDKETRSIHPPGKEQNPWNSGPSCSVIKPDARPTVDF